MNERKGQQSMGTTFDLSRLSVLNSQMIISLLQITKARDRISQSNKKEKTRAARKRSSSTDTVKEPGWHTHARPHEKHFRGLKDNIAETKTINTRLRLPGSCHLERKP